MDHAAQSEEREDGQQGQHDAEDHGLHGNVTLGTLHFLGRSRSAFLAEFPYSHAHGILDDLRLADDADDTGRSDAADADLTRIGAEDLVGRHLADGIGEAHAQDVHAAAESAHQRNDQQPDEQRAAADDEGVLQADDVAQAQDGSARIDLEHQLGLVGHDLAPVHHRGGERFSPGAESRDHEIIDTTDQAGGEQGLEALAAALAADQHLRGSRRLRERILAVLLLDEVFPERDQEQDAQHAAEQRAEEHLHEIHVQSEDVDGRQGEHRAGHDDARAGADALDDDVLAQRAFLFGGTGEADRQDGDRNGCLEHLAHLQAQIGRGGREDDRHDQAEADRPGRDLGIILFGLQKRFVLLAWCEFPEGILRKRSGFVLFFHIILVLFLSVQMLLPVPG